eukprot:9245140-Pyramimonas_sp.AAC.1
MVAGNVDVSEQVWKPLGEPEEVLLLTADHCKHTFSALLLLKLAVREYSVYALLDAYDGSDLLMNPLKQAL